MSEAERDCKHGRLARSCDVCELERTVAEQAAEIERLRVDAERWQFWRSLYDIDNKVDQNIARAIERAVTPEQLDAAVDVARKEKQDAE